MNELKNFPYKRILIVGMARSGTLAAEVLLRNHLQVTVTDLQAAEGDSSVQRLTQLGATMVLGEHPESLLEQTDLIVKNPGIPYEVPFIQAALEKKIPIITEIELLAYLIESEQIISVTGTNGKTTTTTLIGEMLKHDNQGVSVAGNIGVVAVEEARKLAADETLLLELSSFQLMGIEKFHPHIAVLINIHEAHIDYHGTVEAYVAAKQAMIQNQTAADYLVYNMDDASTVEVIQQAKGKHIPFSLKTQLEQGGWTDGKAIYYNQEKIADIEKIVLVGQHNIANILAATCVAKLKGVSTAAIQAVLYSFHGVEHRLQFVRTKNKRLFYNDSKATNTLATQTALRSFKRPVIWLAGGLDRGNDISELLADMDYVKGMVVFGQSAEKFYALGKQANLAFVQIAQSMDEAVNLAYEHSDEKDVILLSPACASWDQYKTYEERGNIFIQAVHNL